MRAIRLVLSLSLAWSPASASLAPVRLKAPPPPGLPAAVLSAGLAAPEPSFESPKAAPRISWDGARRWAPAAIAVSGASQGAPHPVGVGLSIAGAVAGHFGGRVVVNRIAARRGWSEDKAFSARLAVSVASVVAGLSGALYYTRVSSVDIWQGLGVGGVLLALMAQELIANPLEAIKVLATHSISVGDSVQIGGIRYRVRDMTLRAVILDRDAPGDTAITYVALKESPITILESGGARPPRPSLSDLGRAFRCGLWPAARWLLLGAGLVVLPRLLPAAPVPWIRAGAAAALSWGAGAFYRGAVDSMARSGKISPQAAAVAHLAGRTALLLGGGAATLSPFGVHWIKSLGVPALLIGLAARDFFGNVIKRTIALRDPLLKIGNAVEIGGAAGKVADKNFQYVVLQHEGGARSLAAYGLLSKVTALAPGADLAPPKPKETP